MGNVKDKDLGFKRIMKQLAMIDDSHVDVGVLSNAGRYESGGSVTYADVATFNEYGTSKVPERPFFRQAFDKNYQSVFALIDGLRGKIYQGKIGVKGALSLVGEKFKSDVREIFTSGSFVANAPATIKAKGSSQPLIDTGGLRKKIDYKVKLG